MVMVHQQRNVLLQFFKINNEDINIIADKNPKKNNLYTPGTKIKIVGEDISKRKKWIIT